MKLHMKPAAVCFVFLILAAQSLAQSISLIKNYNSCIGVNDIAITSDNRAWFCVTGGLARYTGGSQAFLEQPMLAIPDIYLTALAADSANGIWAASKRGMLYYYRGNRRPAQFWSYASPHWRIRDIMLQDNYLLIGADKGLSLFDTRNHVARKNIMAFGDFTESDIYAILVHADTLYLGMSEGVARFGLDGEAVDAANLGNRTSWLTERFDTPVTAFTISSDGVIAHTTPAAQVGSAVYVADSLHLMRNGKVVAELPSRIRTIGPGPGGAVLIGVAEHYVYRFHRDSLSQITIPGMTYSDISRVYVSSDGHVWFMPRVIYPDTPWWQGVGSFDGTTWKLYNSATVEDFKYLGDNPDFLGIGEDRHGNMWFGGNGSGVKRYNTTTGVWNRYFVGVNDLTQFRAYSGPSDDYWSKCDALATDSSGFTWFSSWRCEGGNIVCTDPAAVEPNPTAYRRFESSQDINVTALCVDVEGRILAGGADGTLAIITHDGTPLDGNGVRIEQISYNAKYYDMAATADTCTWIASSRGLLKWKPGDELTVIDKLPRDVTAVEAESAGILWLGTAGGGLVRYDRFDTGLYGDRDGTAKTFTTENGLVHNAVRSIALDKTRGHLWVGSEQGASQIDLGHQFVQRSDNAHASVYPNPFSRSANREMIFDKLAPNSIVKIYSAFGQLVATLQATGVTQTSREWKIVWRPPADLAYGTYLFVATAQSGGFGVKSGRGAFLIRP